MVRACVCACACVCVCVGGGGGGEEKDIIGLIGMWKCVYIKDLLTLVSNSITPQHGWASIAAKWKKKKKKSRECPRIFWNDTTLMVSFFPVASWI